MGFELNGDIEEKITALIEQMTLDEKIGQMVYMNFGYQEPVDAIRQGRVGLIANVADSERMNRLQRIAVEESRMGIPILFGNDVLHGYRTIFPIPLAEACSWEPQLFEETASLAAEEASMEGTQLIFAPMVDVTREPRWGRIAESPGEDPFLAGCFAKAKVTGFQRGRWDDRASIAACVKHFVAYGAVEGGRDYNAVDVSRQMLADIYLPPFRCAVESGVQMVMTSFNDFNGIPVTANAHLQLDVLRNALGFNGIIIGDDKTIAKLIPQGLAENALEACEKAVLAGSDMDMNSGIFLEHLAELVINGKVPMETINQSVARILRIKFANNLFRYPYAPPKRNRSDFQTALQNTARKSAAKSIVLLKNDGNLLPLDETVQKIAVIGPLAQEHMMGCWSCYGDAKEAVTILEGIKFQAGPQVEIVCAPGCNLADCSREDFAEALRVAREADVAIMVVGESAGMSGEGMCRASLRLPGVQEELVQAVWATGTPTVVVLVNGRPLAIEWVAEHVPAIVETWFLGNQAGHAVADVLFGKVNPSGKLTVSFPRSEGQLPIAYNQKRSGRPDNTGKHFATKYLDIPTTPRYPFGYGLSYTEFAYRNLLITPKCLEVDEIVTMSVEVENVGSRDGEEIVQLYIQDVTASITRPIKELKGFRKISLASGESQRVSFKLTKESLGFYDAALQFRLEPGRFRVWVGPNSANGLEGEFELTVKKVKI